MKGPTTLRTRIKGPNAEQRFLDQREKARERARVHIRLKRAKDPTVRRRNEVYLMLVALFGDACGICGGQSNNGRRLSIDHCHTTNEIRGLLCNRCNLMVGHARDSVEILRAAIAFLERDAYTGLNFEEVLSVPEASV